MTARSFKTFFFGTLVVVNTHRQCMRLLHGRSTMKTHCILLTDV